MGQPRPLFVYFRSFQTQILQKKTEKASAEFDASHNLDIDVCYYSRLVSTDILFASWLTNDTTKYTHLRGKGKYHCTADLMFDWFGFH